MNAPEGAGIQHDEAFLRYAPLQAQRVRAGQRHDVARIDPIRQHLDALCRDSLVDQAPLHRLADGDDAVGIAIDDGFLAPKVRYQQSIAQIAKRDGSVRLYILDIWNIRTLEM